MTQRPLILDNNKTPGKSSTVHGVLSKLGVDRHDGRVGPGRSHCEERLSHRVRSPAHRASTEVRSGICDVIHPVFMVITKRYHNIT